MAPVHFCGLAGIWSAYWLLIMITNCQAQAELPLCRNLLHGQYECSVPTINNKTHESEGCRPNNTVSVECRALSGVECTGERIWYQDVTCRYTNGYYFSTAVGLSVFLGILGIDRFYLGYPAIGILKLLTGGGFLVGNWADIILISTQVVKPADGSEYVIDLNGPRIAPYRANSETYAKPMKPNY